MPLPISKLAPCLSLAAAVLGAACTQPSRPAGPAPQDALAEFETRKFVSAPEVRGLEGFSQAVKKGRDVLVSGQLPLDPGGSVVSGGLEQQAAQAFRNLRAVLLAAGATPEDVLRLQIAVVDLDAGGLAAIRKADTALFAPGRTPAVMVTGVSSLPVSGALIAVGAEAQTPGIFPDRERLQRFRQ